MKGKLVVIEGLDGTGKQTQSERLKIRLNQMGKEVISITFPNYQSEASIPIKMYLNGKFGDDASKVNPYMASTFYAVDRIASYKMYWEKELYSGKTIIADRYTTSNMIHQGSKVANEKLDNYLDWLVDFEYHRLMLPEPDLVIYLDMPFNFSNTLREKRTQKFEGRDIHEQNDKYLKECYKTALYIAKKYGWITISCIEQGKIRQIDDINDEIFKHVKALYE